jgi:hypothetical protein
MVQYRTFGPASHFFPCNVGPIEIYHLIWYDTGPLSGCLPRNVLFFPDYLKVPPRIALCLFSPSTLHYYFPFHFRCSGHPMLHLKSMPTLLRSNTADTVIFPPFPSPSHGTAMKYPLGTFLPNPLICLT